MKANRWLLPEGVEEFLPAEARLVEQLRRRLLDLYDSWGYELVMPPMLEFCDSLLSGVGGDIQLLTLKVTDQLTGQLMGLRADITPQAARIDAHSYIKQGPNRLCYADHVLHAKPKNPLAVRTPLQVGVELFGESGLEADIEVISLLLASIEQVELENTTLDIGHVGLCRALIESVGLSQEQEDDFFELLQTKDNLAIADWVKLNVIDPSSSEWLIALPSLCGGASLLDDAKTILANSPDEVLAAIDELVVVYEVICQRYPQVKVYFDLGEFRGYHYHTGIVFAAYVEGFGDAIANGGRYDHIGEAYGRARPATGFGLNLTSVLSISQSNSSVFGIYAPPSIDHAQWLAIKCLREQGERVVSGLSEQAQDIKELRCDRQLIKVGDDYKVEAL